MSTYFLFEITTYFYSFNVIISLTLQFYERIYFMKTLLKYLKKYKVNLIIGPILKLLEAIIEVLLPIIIAFFIDNYKNFSSTELMYYSIGLVILVLLGLCFCL